jgi:uncharacterized protein (TIGR00251 family)
MRIFVTAKPKARQQEVKKMEGAYYRVSVKEAPQGGKANRAIERTLAEYFQVPVARVSIISGHSSRKKVVEIQIE